MNKNTVKLNILKRMLDKRVLVIDNHITLDYWFGTVKKVIDEYHLSVLASEGESKTVNIFDIRTPTKEFLEKYL